MKKLLLLSILLGGLLGACSTEIDINADWKETTVVYGLLGATDTAHYLRIHKSYLDPERGALEVAQIKDSLYYGPSLVVTVEEVNASGVVVNTYTCERLDTSLLQPGIFAGPEMVLYRFYARNLNANNTYRLTTNTGGNVVTGETQPIAYPGSLPSGIPPGGFVPPSYQGMDWSRQTHSINMRAPRNAKMFDVTVRIIYDEWNRFTVTPTDTPGLQRKTIDWRAAPNRQVINVNADEAFQIRLRGRDMFSFMNAVIPVDPDVNRRLRGTLFIFDFADDNLNTFLQVNQPSSSIVDVRPNFTNIENGLGIFASRRTTPDIKLFETDPTYPFGSPFFRRALGGVGTDSLRTNYPQLNFVP